VKGRLDRRSKGSANPMMQQTLLPEPFDEGPTEDRLIRLWKWAAIMHPGRVFKRGELHRLTGIPESTIRKWEQQALEKLKKLKSIKELKNNGYK